MEKWLLPLLAFATIFTADTSDITDGTCYKDKLLSRLLGTSHTSGTNTPEECKKSCSKEGYKYAGVQYTNECWCGDDQPPASRIRDSSYCNSNCPGDVSFKCGGFFSMNIYKTEKREITDGTCYQDKYISRIFPSSQSQTSRSNTPDECKRTCFGGGYKYAGVQFKSECWCGNETPPASRIRDNSQCFAKCPGDASLKCGAILRMNIYKTDKTEAGLPETCKNSNIKLGNHGNVDINELDKDDCITLVMNINKKRFFERQIYCRPIIGLSPTKSSTPIKQSEETINQVEPRIKSKLLGNSTENESDSDDDSMEKQLEERRKEFLKDKDFTLVRNKRKNISPGKSEEKSKVPNQLVNSSGKHKFQFKRIKK